MIRILVRLGAIVLGLGLMAACGGETSTPEPTPDIAATVQAALRAALPSATPGTAPNIEATVQAAVQATIVAIPAAATADLALAPTSTATVPAPTETPMPTSTATQTPRPSPSPPPTPTGTPRPPPTATPNPPTATPRPPTPTLMPTQVPSTSTPAPRSTPTATPVPPAPTPRYRLESDAVPFGLGRVEAVPAASDGRYLDGSVVQLTSGCIFGFVLWAGDVPTGVDTRADSVFVTMDKDRALTAICNEIPLVAVAGPDIPKYGGTLKLGVRDFGTMDPALMGTSEGSSIYSELAYDSGTVSWYDGSVMPWAIESWTTSSDLTQYTFKVRQGIVFHHGKELRAKDFKFTFDRLLDEETESPVRSPIDYIESIGTVGKYTLVMDLDSPNVFLPAQMSDYRASILPSDVDIDEIISLEFGTGAFILGEHDPDERTVLRRNPNYWRAGKPYIDKVIMFYMPEMPTRIAALRTGAIDAVLNPSFSGLESLSENSNVLIKEASSAGVRVLDFHTNREPFNNNDLRKAFQYAVDRTAVRQATMFGRGANANDHPIGINDEYYWDDQPVIEQDIERARRYLTSAGYPNGFDVVLHTSDIDRMLEMALAFKESVAAAGIRVEVSKDDADTYREEFWMDPCCPFVASSWGARGAHEALDVQLRSHGVWNESYYNNPRLDSLLDRAATEGDFFRRKGYYREIQEILIEDVPALYLMYTPEIVAHRGRVKGVRAHPGPAQTFVEDWWIDE